MEYRVGTVERAIVARFSDGDDLIKGLTDIARTEDIRSGIFHVIGGLRKGRFVAGPEKEKLPPVPVWGRLEKSHEILGIGTIFWEDDEPKIHLHGAFGKRDSVKVGCLRKDPETFLIIEAVIFELKGIDARRVEDPDLGFPLLKFMD
jgi:predicted DNA-binding protein with PD1-like motif